MAAFGRPFSMPDDPRTVRRSAKISAGGERAQDNAPIVIRDAGAAAKFEGHSERMLGAL